MNIYDDTLMVVSPIIITQYKEIQGAYVLAPQRIYQNQPFFTKMLYENVQKKDFRTPFFRLVGLKEDILFLYYWPTTIPETRTGRQGIYLILGFLMKKEFLFQYKHTIINGIIRVIMKLETDMSIDINCMVSDDFFKMIQKNMFEVTNTILESAKEISISSIKINSLKKLLIWVEQILGERFHSQVIFLLNRRLLIPSVEAFLYNSILSTSRFSNYDIYSQNTLSKYFIDIFYYGDNLPNNISKGTLKSLKFTRYIKFFVINHLKDTDVLNDKSLHFTDSPNRHE